MITNLFDARKAALSCLLKIMPYALLLPVWSCSTDQSTAGGDSPDGSPEVQTHVPHSLRIENQPTRGMSYTDSTGTKYQFRHIPATFTNTGSAPMRFDLSLQEDYSYPEALGNKPYTVFPLPELFGLNGRELSELLEVLPDHVHKRSSSKTLEPGEECIMAIGTLYPADAEYGAFPFAVFSRNTSITRHACDSATMTSEWGDPKRALEIGLAIGFTSGSQASPEDCAVLPCGRISVTDR